jgi:hypothetical protein
MVVATSGERAVGSPGAPQPAIARNATLIERAIAKLASTGHESFAGGMLTRWSLRIGVGVNLQDVAAEVLILDDVGKLFRDVRRVDLDVLFL